MGKEEADHSLDYKHFMNPTNPMSDLFSVRRFHHVEFWCSDATTTSRRFSWALGMPIVAKSDLSTRNTTHASYLLRSGELLFLFTAPYSATFDANMQGRNHAEPKLSTANTASIPTFSHAACRAFTAAHGIGVRSVSIEVEDAELAYSISVSKGARSSSPPITLGEPENAVVIAEIQVYNDSVLRFISYAKPKTDTAYAFLPGFEPIDASSSFQGQDYGIRRLDHTFGSVPNLDSVVDYIKSFTGFHEFAGFRTEDVGTAESGLNTMALACNNEAVVLGLGEPVYGTKRRSPFETYLDHNEGPGFQHLALESEDIFWTLREMKKRSGFGGFEFHPAPPAAYYRNLKKRIGDGLSDDQLKACEELGILADRNGDGTLLQIFTKPVGDRPTIIIEIIQRMGCMIDKHKQKPGCGGFGEGNVSELFKCLEEYEKTLKE
ncbi:hypothetical protein OSB04_009337 [Centaurea solstitialis]|uniref:4-hydroxyphenylpyruvate dioxygenase n=1 Tax=Centaurea solstitialis TaxID=347529 RepID=A0AA38TQC3_9ASTR|nr:hypothetical protein OSB04_009337 [Centaurea solstitialis]